MDKTSGVSQPTPSASGRKGIWWAMLVLSFAGLLVSIVLAHIHFKVNTEAGFHSFCGRGSTFNCDDVARSRYSILLGVPTALWGIFGYLLAAAVALAGLRARRAAWTAACGFLLFTGFAVLSAVKPAGSRTATAPVPSSQICCQMPTFLSRHAAIQSQPMLQYWVTLRRISASPPFGP